MPSCFCSWMHHQLARWRMFGIALQPNTNCIGAALDMVHTVAFAARATVHTVSGVTPVQLVFGHNAVPNVHHLANWQCIRERKQDSVDQSNVRENAKCLPHAHKPGDQVLIKAKQKRKFRTDTCLGPHVVDHVFDNGTLHVDEGGPSDVCNTRNVTPHQVQGRHC